MPNLTAALNEHIRRLSRREINNDTRSIRKLTAQHRRDIAALKRQLADLQKKVTFLERQEKHRVAQQPVASTEAHGVRFRADGLKSHRTRLGLSASDLGKLIGVSGKAVYNWENGISRPRQEQIAKLATIRGLGKREAMKRLEMLNGE